MKEIEPEEKPERRWRKGKISQEWENHCRDYPGPYRVHEAANSNHNNAWRAWVAKKHDLSSICEVEGIKPGLQNAACLNPTGLPAQVKRDRLTAEQYASLYSQALAQMVKMPEDSAEWEVYRQKAYNYRIRCFERAYADGVSLSLPEIPRRRRKGRVYKIIVMAASPSLNRYTYAKSPFIQATDKKKWLWLIRGAEGFLECPKATGKRRLVIERYGKRALDPDNLIGGAKCVIIDNLRHWGLLVDDDPLHLEISAAYCLPLRPGEKPHTVIELEDIE